MKFNKLSFSIAAAKFQVLNSHMWVMATILDGAENIFIITEIFTGQP